MENQPKKKKPLLKKWWFWLIVVIVVIGIGAANGKDEPTKVGDSSKTTSAANSDNSSKSAQSNKTKTFKIGDVVALDGLNLSVTKVDKSNGDDFEKPKSGNEFVIIHVKIANKGTEKIDYNPLYFKVQNSKGQITDETFTTIDQDTTLNSGELAPNGEVEGTIAFEEPQGDKGLVLQFQDDIFSKDDKISINLQ
jgi:hypothetical protein